MGEANRREWPPKRRRLKFSRIDAIENPLRRFGLFDEGFLADDDNDPGIADVEAAPVGYEVAADFSALGKADVAVNDGAADARVTADIHVVVDDGIRDFAVTVDADIVADDRFLNTSARDDRATSHNGIERDAHTLRIGENKFCRRILVLPGAQRPRSVVEVENRRHTDEIHVGFVVSVERANIAPVESIFRVVIAEVVSKDAVLRNDARKNVLAKIMVRFGILGVRKKNGDQQLRIENVDAHRGIAVAGVMRRLFGDGGFFLEADDAPFFVGLNDAELLGGLGGGYFDGADGHVGAGVAVLLEHAAVIHFVDVIAGKDENEFRAFAADGINVLVHGVGGALIPLLRY